MSVHVIPRRRSAPAYDVRWRTSAGEQRARRFDDRNTAADFDAAVVATMELRRAQVRMAALTSGQRAWLAHVDE